jgi:regulator of protease activity HflC (stomatin/prohibitin superfamily)
MQNDHSPSIAPTADPLRAVILVVIVASLLGMVLAIAGGVALGNPVVVAAAPALWLAAGVLFGVARAQAARSRAEPTEAGPTALGPRDEEVEAAETTKIWLRRQALKTLIAIVGGAGIGVVLLGHFAMEPASVWATGAAAAAACAGAWLAATAARYFEGVEPERLPEAPGLAQAGRVLAWVLIAAAVGAVLPWTGSHSALRVLLWLVMILEGWVCVQLVTATDPMDEARFPTALPVFSLLGSRANPLASVLDVAQRELGIDLRTSWALTVVRKSAVPLAAGLLGIGWLVSAITVVGVEEQGLVERLGVPVAGPPLEPGVHAHWPWPVDSVLRFPVRRVQALHVGHEGEEGGGPEDVLWARQHGNTEYTLLLGNGRDLIAVDAAVQFRISDPRAWHYQTQNPADALRAIAYRAVMKVTVGRTLAEALSENVSRLTDEMRVMVQADADALGLGVAVVGFTIGGMHPPVGVASAYQAVVSAALRKTTAAIEARAYHNEVVPKATAQALTAENAARADGARALGAAAGQAWSFRALESEYRGAPDEYRFRRRLETLESSLGGRRFTVLDARIQRDGGELWLTN